jgi:hypothetical protein
MTLATPEFMRRFLLHVLPSGFHRIRHYGLLANANRKNQIDTARQLLDQPAPQLTTNLTAVPVEAHHVQPQPTFAAGGLPDSLPAQMK